MVSKSNLSPGFAIEQWLSDYQEENYTIIRLLRIDKEKDQTYTLAYFECFDEGNENALDIYKFSILNPDEPFGVLTQFDNIEDALTFSENSCGASNEKYVSAGMIRKEYHDYLRQFDFIWQVYTPERKRVDFLKYKLPV